MNKPSILRKLSVGDAFVPGRDFLNSLISAGQDSKRGEDANPEDFADTLSQVDVLIKNESDHDYGQYDVVGLGVALIDPNTDVNEFLRMPAFSSDSPVDPSDIGNWALCLEPIEMGKYGQARAGGVCFAGITAGSSDPVQAFAEMADSSPNLVFATDGSAKVLWAEATGTDRWAIVRIGGGGGGSTSTTPLSFCFLSTAGAVIQSIPNATWTLIDWASAGAVSSGDPTCWDGHTKLSTVADGTYIFGAALGFAANATGYRGIAIVDLAVSMNAMTIVPSAGAGVETIISVVNPPETQSAGAYRRVYAYQNSGGALNVLSAASPPFGGFTNSESNFWLLQQANSVGGTPSNVQAAMVSADVTNATNTFSNLSDLSVNVVAGQKYRGRIDLWCENSTAAEGIKFDCNGGTATMTDFRSAAGVFATGSASYTQGTTLGAALTDVLNWTLLTGGVNIVIIFELTCNASGTFLPRVAENSAHTSGTVTVRKGTNVEITKAG